MGTHLKEISWNDILQHSRGMVRLDKEHRGIDANANSYLIYQGNNSIGLVTLGHISPVEFNVSFGRTLTVWNLYLNRDSETEANLDNIFRTIETFAKENGYESIFIMADEGISTAGRKADFVIRDTSVSDIKYLTKRIER